MTRKVKSLKGKYEKFRQDCQDAYAEFKPLMRKLKSLSKRAGKLSEELGNLPPFDEDGNSAFDFLLFFRLSDFHTLMEASSMDIDAILHNIQQSTFNKAVGWNKMRKYSYERKLQEITKKSKKGGSI